MSTKTTSKTSSRYQITFPKNSKITTRIISLTRKFNGLDLPEIVKLALITLDDKTPNPGNERLPDAQELKAIEDYLANPDLASDQEIADLEKELGVKLKF